MASRTLLRLSGLAARHGPAERISRQRAAERGGVAMSGGTTLRVFNLGLAEGVTQPKAEERP
jgi:hypothetical protein